MPRLVRVALAALLLALVAAQPPAQCGIEARSLAAVPGASNTVKAMHLWDPDGSGPAGPWVVLGGTFDAAGTSGSRGVAGYDESTGEWHAFGGGLWGHVRAFGTAPNGDLVAGGSFNIAAGGPTIPAARWDGTAWSPFGSFSNWASINCFATLPSGALVVGGGFNSVDGVPSLGLAVWDGASWSDLGGGVVRHARSMCVAANGDLLVGGFVSVPGGPDEYRVARWNGQQWTSLGGNLNTHATALAELPNGDVVAGANNGHLGQSIGLFSPMVRWDGTNWSDFAPPGHPGVWTLCSLPNGHLVTGGFPSGTVTALTYIAEWDGVSWSSVGTGCNTAVQTLLVAPSGDLYAGGDFSVAGGVEVARVARWDGSAWSRLADGPDGPVLAVAFGADGALYAGGGFTRLGAAATPGVARWDGASWSALGAGVPGTVWAIGAAPDGSVYLGCALAQGRQVARWDGAALTWLPGTFDGEIRGLAVAASGEVVAVGAFTHVSGLSCAHAARWNGVAWSAMGAGLDLEATVAFADATGAVVVGGSFTLAGGIVAPRVARWNGTNWSGFGAGPGGVVTAVAELPNGDLVASGGGPVSQWNGSAWSLLPVAGTIFVRSIVALPDGDLLLGGSFQNVGSVAQATLCRWDGATSQAVSLFGMPLVMAIAGDRVAMTGSGAFALGGVGSDRIAELHTTCAAATTSLGGGCAGGAELVLDGEAYAGATLTLRADSLPTPGIAVGVAGTQPVAPGAAFSQWFAGALPGCELRLAPLVTEVLTGPVPGVVERAITLPNTSAIAGLDLGYQVVGFGLGSVGGAAGITSVSSSDALLLTIGAW